MKSIVNMNGLTVAELRALIADWPDTDGDGEPCEVWVGTGKGLSSVVTHAWVLNKRQGENGKEWADLLLKHDV